MTTTTEPTTTPEFVLSFGWVDDEKCPLCGDDIDNTWFVGVALAGGNRVCPPCVWDRAPQRGLPDKITGQLAPLGADDA